MREFEFEYFQFMIPTTDSNKRTYSSFGFRLRDGTHIYVGSNMDIISAFIKYCVDRKNDSEFCFFEVNIKAHERLRELKTFLEKTAHPDAIVIFPSSAKMVDDLIQLIDPDFQKLKAFAATNGGQHGNA